ncbi:MAG: hypothetical protein ACK5M3_05515 [Dysgonomonas sp.]
MNISKQTIETMKGLGYSLIPSFQKSYKEPANFKVADRLGIVMWTDDVYFSKYVPTPKEKEITVEWLMEKINQESVYKNLADVFAKLLVKESCAVYPASYGIGVDNLFKSNERTQKLVEDKLNRLGIKFRTEYSDAMWVLRFVISKEKENIEKLLTL